MNAHYAGCQLLAEALFCHHVAAYSANLEPGFVPGSFFFFGV